MKSAMKTAVFVTGVSLALASACDCSSFSLDIGALSGACMASTTSPECCAVLEPLQDEACIHGYIADQLPEVMRPMLESTLTGCNLVLPEPCEEVSVTSSKTAEILALMEGYDLASMDLNAMAEVMDLNAMLDIDKAVVDFNELAKTTDLNTVDLPEMIRSLDLDNAIAGHGDICQDDPESATHCESDYWCEAHDGTDHTQFMWDKCPKTCGKCPQPARAAFQLSDLCSMMRLGARLPTLPSAVASDCMAAWYHGDAATPAQKCACYSQVPDAFAEANLHCVMAEGRDTLFMTRQACLDEPPVAEYPPPTSELCEVCSDPATEECANIMLAVCIGGGGAAMCNACSADRTSMECMTTSMSYMQECPASASAKAPECKKMMQKKGKKGKKGKNGKNGKNGKKGRN